MEENRAYNIPTLPVDKDCHIFVCYTRCDTDLVHNLVENLEKRGLKCSYHERDFTAGHPILINMLDKIRRSMHMLVILSQDFVNSGYAQHEVAEAMHIKISEGYSIIPLLIEPCTVPDFLKNMTYIDATNVDVNEMQRRVLETVANQKTLADLQDSITEICVDCPLKKLKQNWKGSFMQHYQLIFDERDRERITESGLQITEYELAELETTVSKSKLVRFWHVYGEFRALTYLMSGILILCYVPIHLGLMLKLFDRPKVQDNKNGIILLALIITVPLLCLVIALVILSYDRAQCSNWKRFTNNLQIKAMQQLMLDLCRFNKDARVKQRIIILSYCDSTCSLVLMRYDFQPCKAYFVKRCERKEVLRKYQRDGESILDYTNRLFDSFLRSSDLAMLLQPSTLQQKRHKMANAAKCICLLVEEMLS